MIFPFISTKLFLFILLILSFVVKHASSPSLLRHHQGQRDPGRGNKEKKRYFVKAKKKRKGKGRQEMSGWEQENQTRKWRANLCFKTFPLIVSAAVRWEQGSESWWALVLCNNHQVCQHFLFYPLSSSSWFVRLPRFLHFLLLPFHFSCLTDVTHSGLLISLTHTLFWVQTH